MHQPSLTPHESSYFVYRIRPFRRPPELSGGALSTVPVVVAGAGPVGLLVAIFLRQQGVPCVLLEAEAQVSGGSRALAFTHRTMEILDRAGVADAMLEHALTWSSGRSYYRRREVHHLEIPRGEHDRFWPMTNLPQCMLEEILLERALALGVDVRFQTRLDAFDEGRDGLTLRCDTPEGPYDLQAAWLVGCDGARSAVRRLKGLRFTGLSYESRFVIADIRMKIDAPAGRRCYFDMPWLPGESALMHKAPFDIWRLDYRVPDDVPDAEALDRDRLRGQIQAHLDDIGVAGDWAFEWVTLYKPNALTLESYRAGRVLLAGDAAHLLPVFGVRGLNTGAQDAANLAWKLALVARGLAPEALLDTYSDERVADARQICVEAGRSTRMMAPPTAGHALLRRAVLSLAQDRPFVRDLLHWRTSHPIDYDDSVLSWRGPGSDGFAGGPGPGALARDVKLADGSFLLGKDPGGFGVLVFGAGEADWRNIMQDVEAGRARGLPVAVWVVGEGSAGASTAALGAGPDAGSDADAGGTVAASATGAAKASAASAASATSATSATASADRLVADPDGRVARAWGVPSGPAVYVLRPDGYVGGRTTLPEPGRVAAILAHNLHLS